MDRERNRNGQYAEAEPTLDENASLTVKLDELADLIATDALNTDKADERLDSFKVLSRFWIDRAKLGKKKPDDDADSDGGLPAMRERLKAIGGGD
ncbi:MAG TPA: hypothetical protein VFV07_09865 [Rhizomicrobium sp.]|nr:hypothetical protein [Rhizomicrobium sp.]